MNRIYIYHTDAVSVKEALEAVKVCLFDGMEPGAVYTLNNGLGVFYKDKTKNPVFDVWMAKYNQDQ